MTRKPETIIKKRLESFIAEQFPAGEVSRRDITDQDGNRWFLIAPNRFSYGYIRLIIPSQGLIWSADLKKDDPRHVTCVRRKLMVQQGEGV